VVAPLRVAFFGTPGFALTTLEHLHRSGHQTVVVVTQPDRPRGRGQKLTPSPVKAFATSNGLPVLQPERMKQEGLLSALGEFGADLSVVAAYGKILPRDLIAQPRLGTINVHGSLLPRWRGAAPVHRAILSGDRVTGVTIMRIVEALDAGPMLARQSVTIGPNETSAELEGRLADLGGRLLVETVNRLAAGPIDEEPQPETGVTYANRLERRERRVEWATPAAAIHNQIRGLQPWPVAAVLFRNRRLQLLGSEVAHDRPADRPPGTVTEVTHAGLTIAAGPGAVRLTRVQPEGRGPMSIRDFLAGHRIEPGEQLDPIPIDQ